MREVECALCGARDAEPVYSGRDNRHAFDEQIYHIVRCRTCGMIYLNPRPEESDMARIYHAEYYRPETDPPSPVERVKAGYLPGPPGYILDVGCGKGDFLSEMKSRGWTVLGVEYSPDCPNPHGLDIRRGDLTRAGFTAGQFDALTFWNSLEHMIHPNEVVQEASRILKSGGRLVLQVPNFNSICQRWMRGEDIPRHVMMFTPKTIRRFLEKHGFRVRRVVQRDDICSGGCREAVVFLVKRLMGRTWEDILSDQHNASRQPRRSLPWLALKVIDRIVTVPLSHAARIFGYHGSMTVDAVRT